MHTYISAYVYIYIYLFIYIYICVYINEKFPQLVSAMRLTSGECLIFVQFALLYKLDVIYSKSITNDVSVPSAEKITLVDMYRKSRYKDFLLLFGKIELSIPAVWM